VAQQLVLLGCPLAVPLHTRPAAWGCGVLSIGLVAPVGEDDNHITPALSAVASRGRHSPTQCLPTQVTVSLQGVGWSQKACTA